MIAPLTGRAARRKALAHRLRIASTARPLHIAPNAAAPAARQRRKSSSKPSSPPGGGERGPVAPPAEASAKSSAPVPRKRAAAKASPPKTREAAPKTTDASPEVTTPYNVPSVPSTQHLSPPDVHVASIFALHRPISVVAPLPPPVTSNQFAKLFAVRKSGKPPPEQVMLTLSAAVKSLDQMAQRAELRQRQGSPRQQQNGTMSGTDLRNAVTQAVNSVNEQPTHLDGPPTTASSLDEIVKNFRPFVPPPPPMAWSDRGRARTAKAIRASTPVELPAAGLDPTTNEAPSAPDQTPFRERMQERHQAWEQRVRQRHELVWRAISVRRQRKLKMKKHKYKKLQRRLRNLKRRQDRL